jgi:quinolinate synthase
MHMKNTLRKLLKEKNAILLAHNYQPPEIQDVADLCGDSLELSIQAARTDAVIIVFCGVHFMAETASILSPQKTVLLPRKDAGCPMADMITVDALEARISELSGSGNPVPVVTYVNSSAAVKARSTICCTSANAVKVVSSLDSNEILMGPDKNLARYAASKTKKKIHFWEGYCPYHDILSPEDVRKARAAHPDALFMAHPECRLEVLEMADVVASTSGMLTHARNSDRREFIVGTEIGLLYPLKKQNPQKAFFPASPAMECVDMKKITLPDILRSLERLDGEVKVPEGIRKLALNAVQRMVEIT